jgi:PKD repeat protein
MLIYQFFQVIFIISFLSSFLFGKTDSLYVVKQAVEIFKKNGAASSVENMNILLRNNDVVNQLAHTGKISNTLYQKLQKEFAVFNKSIADKAASYVGCENKTQLSTKGFSPRTDSDYILSSLDPNDPITPEKIKKAIEKYNELMNKSLGTQNVNYAKKLDTDLMADPKGLTEAEFEEIAKLNNDAYKRPKAAAAEAKKRIYEMELKEYYKNGQQGKLPKSNLTPEEINAYQNEMNDFITKKAELIKINEKLMKNPDLTPERLSNLESKTRLYRQQQAKYRSRLEEINIIESGKPLPEQEIDNLTNKAKDRTRIGESKLTQDKLTSATSSSLNKNYVNTLKQDSALNKMKFMKNSSGKVQKYYIDKFAEIAVTLPPAQQGELLEQISDKELAKLINMRMKELNRKLLAGVKNAEGKSKIPLKIVNDTFILAILLNTADDISSAIKGEKSWENVGLNIADVVSMGNISAGIAVYKSISKKFNDKDAVVKLRNDAQASEDNSYILSVGIQLRKNGIPKNEVAKIMSEMFRGNMDAYYKKLKELRKRGKKISILPRNYVEMEYPDDTPEERAKKVWVEAKKVLAGIFPAIYGYIKHAGEFVFIRVPADIESALNIQNEINNLNTYTGDSYTYIQSQLEKMRNKLIQMGADEKATDIAIKLYKRGDKKRLEILIKKMRKNLYSSHLALKVTGLRYVRSGASARYKALIIDRKNNVIHLPQVQFKWYEGENLLSEKEEMTYNPVNIKRHKIRLQLLKNGKKLAEYPFTIRVYQTVNISISLNDPKKKQSITNGTVTLTNTLHSGKHYIKSLSNGLVKFQNIPPGIYTYSTSVPGYLVATGQKSFTTNEIYSIDLREILTIDKEKKKENHDFINEEEKLLTFKLNKTNIVMGHNQNVGISATAITSKGPVTIPKHVTPEVVWTTDNPDVAQVVQGVIKSRDTNGRTIIHAQYTTDNGKTLTTECQVEVRDLTENLPVIDFDILGPGESSSFHVGDKIFFQQKITNGEPKNFDFIWYFDDGNEDRGSSVVHNFTKAGRYTIRLVVKSRKTGKEDAYTKSIDVIDWPVHKTEDKTDEFPVRQTAETQNPKPIASHRNKFDIVQLPNLDIQIRSSYWHNKNNGYGEWSEPVVLGKI